MKITTKLFAMLLALVMMVGLLAACGAKETKTTKAQAEGTDTPPAGKSKDGAEVEKTGAPEETEAPTETEEPVAADKFLLELKELSMKIELPISWQDRMTVFRDSTRVALLPPPEEYDLPENKAGILIEYVDIPRYYGHTFAEATSDDLLLEARSLPSMDYITEKVAMKLMGRDALKLTYYQLTSKKKKLVQTDYLIDDDKGRFYRINVPVATEGLEGLATFVADAEEAVESITPFLVDPAVITYEEKEGGFALDLPGNWNINKNEDGNAWMFQPPVHTYDCPHNETKLNIIHYAQGEKGNSFAEVTSPEGIKQFTDGVVATSEPGKIGAADAVFVRWEREVGLPPDSMKYEYLVTLIDDGKGGFYYCTYSHEVGNETYQAFLAAVEQIMQTFRLIKS
ncbi:MAG: hypothetical protein ACOYEL_03335 [Saccharofermentanales bacterium]|jgi:hypothetical protein